MNKIDEKFIDYIKGIKNLCSDGHYDIIKYLYYKYGIDNTPLISGFCESFYNGHYNICDFLLDKNTVIADLLNFNLDKLISKYQLEGNNKALVWLLDYKNKFINKI